MKILFICPSLEDTKDGVGDYTRLLAGTLIQQGHQIACLALNDKYVSDPLSGIDTSGFSYLRLSYNKSWGEKMRQAKDFVDAFHPECVSLQFAPYPYQKKGCPIWLAKRLQQLGDYFHWHIMFHELWVGRESFKLKVYNTVQQRIITNLIKTLSPMLIHTQLPIHMERLSSIGYKAKGLPLFSNIPHIDIIDENKVTNEKYFTVAFFSQFTYSDPILFTLKRLNNLAHSQNKKLRVIIMGGQEGTGSALLDILKRKLHSNIIISYIGNRSAADISVLMQTEINIGITPIQRAFIGKSGTVAAFANNGIPVISPITSPINNSNSFLVDNLNNLIMKSVDLTSYRSARNAAQSVVNSLNPYKIAFTFIQDLKAALPVDIAKSEYMKKVVS